MRHADFNYEWRNARSTLFELEKNSTTGQAIPFDFWGKAARIYTNANFSIYSAQKCNARCAFCVEELRPSSRGTELAVQKIIEQEDSRYFGALHAVLQLLAPLRLSVSLTGGEASKDRRLPRILEELKPFFPRKLTLTTNGSGLWDVHDQKPLVQRIAEANVHHLNISIAHPDWERNAYLMGYRDGLSWDRMRDAIRVVQTGGTRVRLSCVLLNGEIDSLERIREYLDFARTLGVDNVIFRQLMKTDPLTHSVNHVVKYSDQKRTELTPILQQISAHSEFYFQRQVMGYYYYVEVWKYAGMDVVFEEAELAHLEAEKRRDPALIHELIFHPNAKLCSTWQPWDGILGPAALAQETTRTVSAL